MPLRPSPTLASRLVTIKGYLDANTFRPGLERQIDGLGLHRKAEITVGARRVLRIKGMTIVGFAVVLCGLTDDDSLKIQANGLGGRRRFGCGVFVPSRAAVAVAAGESHGD
jgi:CRISPR-associated protein Cas6